MPYTPLSLLEVLSEISARGLVITRAGRLWAPHTHVPMVIRQGIHYHRAALMALLASGDTRLCASVDAHWRYWQGDTCEMCAHLEAEQTKLSTSIDSYIRQIQRTCQVCG